MIVTDGVLAVPVMNARGRMRDERSRPCPAEILGQAHQTLISTQVVSATFTDFTNRRLTHGHSTMGKRKRDIASQEAIENGFRGQKVQVNGAKPQAEHHEKGIKVLEARASNSQVSGTLQIVVGTYEKLLHGITATITKSSNEISTQFTEVEFADTFLFNAHDSAVRCLAVAPITKDSDKVILASGGSDQVINLYSLSTRLPSSSKGENPPRPLLSGNKINENPKNREIGSLQHHAGSINALHFPSKSKLLSAAEDSTIAVARTRDWTILASIKAPLPKTLGQPNGDTALIRASPAGINDFALHPSMKLMLSLGKGEKCMRLWNLVTGKKAGVLNFDRDFLHRVGEGRHSSGEGRKIRWNHLGEEFVVAFEYGCVIYGVDSAPRCYVLPSPRTKIQQVHYLTIPIGEEDISQEFLAVSTEDGRIVLYSTSLFDLENTPKSNSTDSLPNCSSIGQLVGLSGELTSRIKDFEYVSLPGLHSDLFVSGSSNGTIGLWLLDTHQLITKLAEANQNTSSIAAHGSNAPGSTVMNKLPLPMGKLLGTYATGNRIMCIKAFEISGP